jgi:hypothetical protein
MPIASRASNKPFECNARQNSAASESFAALIKVRP